MTKTQFDQLIAEKAMERIDGLSIKKVTEVRKAFEETILEIIATEDFINLEFGKIGGKTRAPRNARNPKTGETFMTEEKKGQPYYKPNMKSKA